MPNVVSVCAWGPMTITVDKYSIRQQKVLNKTIWDGFKEDGDNDSLKFSFHNRLQKITLSI